MKHQTNLGQGEIYFYCTFYNFNFPTQNVIHLHVFSHVSCCEQKFRFLHHFLGAVAKLHKETVTFIMLVCPSVCMEQLGPHRTDFQEI